VSSLHFVIGSACGHRHCCSARYMGMRGYMLIGGLLLLTSACAGRQVRTEVLVTEISNRILAPSQRENTRAATGKVRDRVRLLPDRSGDVEIAHQRQRDSGSVGTSGFREAQPQTTGTIGTSRAMSAAQPPATPARNASPGGMPIGASPSTQPAASSFRTARVVIPAAMLALIVAVALLRRTRRR
jgi:hypothetical protein